MVVKLLRTHFLSRGAGGSILKRKSTGSPGERGETMLNSPIALSESKDVDPGRKPIVIQAGGEVPAGSVAQLLH